MDRAAYQSSSTSLYLKGVVMVVAIRSPVLKANCCGYLLWLHVAILNRGKETFGIEASLPLGNVLGWTKSMPTNNMTPGATLTCEDTVIDPTRGFKILYVYCPKLVEETIVGHTSASLLNKFVPDYSQSTEYIQFDNPLYIKLREGVRTIPSITVEIADSLGRNLLFPGNSLTVPKVTLTFTCLQNG